MESKKSSGNSFRKKRRISRVVVSAAVASLIAGPSFVVPANAASGTEYIPEKLGWGKYLNFWGEDTSYLGSLSVTGKKPTDPVNHVAFCVDWQVTTDYGEMDHQIKDATGENAKIVNFLIARYGADTNNHPEIAVAIHHLMDKTRNSTSSYMDWGWAEQNIPEVKNQLLPKAKSWIETAKKYIGNYTLKPKVTINGYGGEVTDLLVKSSAGNNVASFGDDLVKLTVTLSGNAVFKENNSKTITVNPGDTPDIKLTGEGTITANVKTNAVLPGNTAPQYIYEDGKNQNKVIRGETTSVSGSASASVEFPDLGTSATDKADGDKVLYYKGGTIVDKVSYTNLIVGKSYTIQGELMDKATGKGTGIKANKTFTADKATGSINLEFKVPEGYAGKTLVAFERMSSEGLEVATHTDLNDKEQTVTVADAPSLKTKALDKLDNDHNIVQSGGDIIDTVTYKDLMVGQEYVVKGELMDKATGKSTGVKGEAKFTPTKTDGSVKVDFKLPKGFEGKTLVAFEKLYDADNLNTPIAEHTDINDVDQTIYVADMGTTATDQADGDHYLVQTGGKIVDTIAYTNLKPGLEYTVSGELMDKGTGKGTGIKGTAKFTPTKPNGETKVIFDVPATYAGKSLTAFETISYGSQIVAEHKDINDEDQTVHIVDIGTTALDATDDDHYIVQRGGKLVDNVAYKNLKVGTEYTIEGELMDQATGKSTGVKKSQKFTPSKTNGTVKVNFDVPDKLAGKTITVFETLKVDGNVVAEHKDIKDANQTVYIADIGTTATDQKDGDQYIVQAGGKVVDTVAYTNLKPGVEYTINGELMDQDTGKSTGIKASTKFTPTEPNGTAEVVFTVGAEHAGKSLTAFETVLEGDKVIAEHKDINDVKQTVYILDIGTKARDAEDDDQYIIEKGGKVIDFVSYENLKPGEEYTVTGELMDKETGEATGIKGEAKFTPTKPSGKVEVEFTIPEGYKGKTLVAFETLYNKDVEILAEHKDINDEEQTVYIAEIGTTALDESDDDHYLIQAGGKIVDNVAYKNLEPGVKYTLEGELMDQETGESTGIKANKTFTPKSANGSTKLTFDVPAEFKGKSLTVFETVKDGDKVIAEHKDINDANQTVHVTDINTDAVDAEDQDKFLFQHGGTVVDTVTFKNLEPGVEYIVSGELMERVPVQAEEEAPEEEGTEEAPEENTPQTAEAGIEAPEESEKPSEEEAEKPSEITGQATGIKNEIRFTPDTASGTIQLTFEVPEGWAGKSLTAFDKIVAAENPDVIVAAHEDINSDAQTVELADIGTIAIDPTDGDKFIDQAGGVIQDTVKFTNLVPGKTYTVRGELQERIEVEAEEPAATETPAPSESASSTESPAPSEEPTEPAETEVPTESAPAEESAPVDETEAPTDGEQGAEEEALPNYEAKGTGIWGETTFVAEESDGEVVVNFQLPAGYGNKTLVIYEAMFENNDGNIDLDKPVAVHADIHDANQTVVVSDMGTTAYDKLDEDNFLIQEGGIVVDEVEYNNFAPGEYVLEGELMDQETGESTGIKATKEFTVTEETTSGFVEIEFEVDRKWAGKSLTAFESATPKDSDKPTAEHKDINDDEQTVHFADAKTSAEDQADGDKILDHNGGIILDSIKYTNLVPGVEYVASGELMDKATGKGTGITGTTKFTPETSDGIIEVAFKVDGNHAGKTLVAFEEIHQGDLLVADHKDINDVEQTVTVATPEEPAPVVPPKINSGNGAGFTGGNDFLLIGTGAALLLAAAGAGIYFKRRRNASTDPASIDFLND